MLARRDDAEALGRELAAAVERDDADAACRLRHELTLCRVAKLDPSSRLLDLAFVRRVGQGSYGEVLAVRATHARGSSGPVIALKAVVCRDARRQREVLAEVATVKAVASPHVVRTCVGTRADFRAAARHATSPRPPKDASV